MPSVVREPSSPDQHGGGGPDQHGGGGPDQHGGGPDQHGGASMSPPARATPAPAPNQTATSITSAAAASASVSSSPSSTSPMPLAPPPSLSAVVTPQTARPPAPPAPAITAAAEAAGPGATKPSSTLAPRRQCKRRRPQHLPSRPCTRSISRSRHCMETRSQKQFETHLFWEQHPNHKSFHKTGILPKRKHLKKKAS